MCILYIGTYNTFFCFVYSDFYNATTLSKPVSVHGLYCAYFSQVWVKSRIFRHPIYG